MSFLSVALTRAVEKNQLTQADLAKKAGLTAAHISRLCRGGQTFVADKDLVAILGVITDPLDRAEIVAARCMDNRIGPGSELVQILVGQPDGRSVKVEKGRPSLPKKAEQALDFLRSEIPNNPSLEKHLIGYAELMGWKPKGTKA